MRQTNLSQEFLEKFQKPGKEFRGTPFWSWNTKLDENRLEEQIEQFREMGMGGFYIHTRVGLNTEYMGTEYMNCVKKAVQIAKEKELYCCLYDEDRWPSGYGGGRVTEKREYRSRNLLITPYRQGTKVYDSREFDSMASASPQGNGEFLAAYDVKLNGDGTLASYLRCPEDAKPRPGCRIWYVYLEIAHDSPWFNNQSYVDTMNPKAIRYFLELTHEKYKKAVGEEFGKTIPSVFTDEPQFGRKKYLGTPWSVEEVMLPFTDDFSETYQAAYGENLMEHIPELLWELPDHQVSRYRYWYHDHVTERFAKAYSDQVGEWCKNNGIRLAGHMMEEPTLQSQTQAIGEVMRSLRGFSLPGIDMLCDAHEYTTAKQAESICHQFGREGVVSELYGVTNWDFDFRRHKLQGDWQAALGITHRVHHLNWMSMGGEAKRDYPAAIGFQSPWYREYGIVETHFARVNTAMRRGIPVVKIGVIHPIESYWLLFGPTQQTGPKRQELEQRFQNITEWLLFGNLDFDYISESLLPDEWDGKRVGKMDYDVIVIPGCLTLRTTTLSILKEMKDAGKKILFAGNPPEFVDAVKNEDAAEFAGECIQIPFSRAELLQELEEYRLVDIRFHGEKHLKKPNHKKNWNGEHTEKLLYQMRAEGENRWLFIANGRKESNPDLALPDDVKIEVTGYWKVTELDTLTGSVKEIFYDQKNGNTILYKRLYEHDSLLLFLEPYHNPGEGRAEKNAEQKSKNTVRNLFRDSVEIVREEPNVLLLDMPEYCFEENGSFHGPEEILRIDNKLREKLDLPPRRAALAQPWIRKEKKKPYRIALKYEIQCETDISHVWFAMEEREAAEIYLDGALVEDCGTKRAGEENDIKHQERKKTESEDILRGYYVDPCIRTAVLPQLSAGTHTLVLEIDFTDKVNLEACYLLGDFSVEVRGSRTVIREERREFCWGSLTEQGMPFYGGNAVYRTEVFLDEGTYILEVSKYRAPLLQVIVDGKKAGNIIGAPYRVFFEIAQAGKHILELKSFGNRVNTFGAVHNCDENEIYFDPNAWRTTDESWAYEYQVKKTGILKAPVLWKSNEN